MKTTNKTKLFGILGTPIEHTLSPKMHSYMAESLGLDMAYLAFDVAPENLHTAMDGLKAVGACGFNITAPHKIEIMRDLDEIKDDAVRMNSVNTIVKRHGKWLGFNTDGDGFCGSLILEGCEIKNKNVLIMGAGGSARGVCYKLAEYGAASITMIARTKEKIHIIGEMVKKYSDTEFFDSIDMSKKYDIIINSTPLGMHPNDDKNPCDFMELIDSNTTCCDLIYNPKKTLFLKEAEDRGAKIINGLGMLVLQGIIAFEIFCNVKLDRAKFYKELSRFLDDFKI